MIFTCKQSTCSNTFHTIEMILNIYFKINSRFNYTRGKVWYLIVSIPDLCIHSYFYFTMNLRCRSLRLMVASDVLLFSLVIFV